MADRTFIDFVEDAMGTIERISNVAQTAAGRGRPMRRPTPTRSRAAASPPPARGTAEFAIVESIDAYTGRPEWIVRNGRGDSASCSSLAFAQRVRDALG